jgi:hypothetical protein
LLFKIYTQLSEQLINPLKLKKMKTIKIGKKISLKKENIAFLDNTQLNQVRGGGLRTWMNCDLPPADPGNTSHVCIAER